MAELETAEEFAERLRSAGTNDGEGGFNPNGHEAWWELPHSIRDYFDMRSWVSGYNHAGVTRAMAEQEAQPTPVEEPTKCAQCGKPRMLDPLEAKTEALRLITADRAVIAREAKLAGKRELLEEIRRDAMRLDDTGLQITPAEALAKAVHAAIAMYEKG